MNQSDIDEIRVRNLYLLLRLDNKKFMWINKINCKLVYDFKKTVEYRIVDCSVHTNYHCVLTVIIVMCIWWQKKWCRSRQCFSRRNWKWIAHIEIWWKGCASIYIGASNNDDEDSWSSRIISLSNLENSVLVTLLLSDRKKHYNEIL